MYVRSRPIADPKRPLVAIHRTSVIEIRTGLRVNREAANYEGNDLAELTDDQLHAEYAISQETLKYHKEQVGHVSAKLHELTVKLAEKKKERDTHVAHYDSIRAEFTRRKKAR